MTVRLSVLSEVSSALLMHILTVNAVYIIQLRNTLKMYHILSFVKMVRELKRVRTDV
jgi:hypothetical protein